MPFDPNKLTNAQQQKIFKVLDWIEEHEGEQGAKSQFATKLRQLGKELGLDDSETKDLEALIDRRLGESRLIKAAAQQITEDSRAFHFAVKECVELARAVVPEEQVQIAAAIVSLAKRRLLNGDADDTAVGRKLETIERQLDNLANSL
jgi:hypothetical protein